MNDQQPTPPEPPADQPPADQQPTDARGGFSESTPVRVLSGVVAFAAPCLVVATAIGLAALMFNLPSQEEDAGSLLQAAVVFGVTALMRCWLAGAITVVMTNSFLLGGRSVVARRCAALGVVTGLIACSTLPIHLIFGADFANSVTKAMPYILAVLALVQCLAWRAKEDTPDNDAGEQRTDSDNSDDQPDGSES